MTNKKELLNCFLFEDYSLYPNEGLFHRNKWIRTPPKELDILTILVENAGKVVCKDFFFQQVWHSGDVSEESLTRCIYSLRKLLGKRFIETVYRKGYLFKANVSTHPISSNTATNKLVAIFPFHFHKETGLNPDDVLYEITHQLNKSQLVSIDIMPTLVTCRSKNWAEIENIIYKFNPAYYIMGKTFKTPESISLILEIIHSKEHRLTFQRKVQLTNNLSWIDEVCRDICNFFTINVHNDFHGSNEGLFFNSPINKSA